MPRKTRRAARTSPPITEIVFSEAEAIAALTAYATAGEVTVPDGDASLILSQRGDKSLTLHIKES